MIGLVGKEVVVETVETIYSGRLIEIGETEVYLQAEMGWLVIPVEKIISIRESDWPE